METISRALLTFLLNAVWQVPLVAAVAVLACRAMRHGPASHRHAVWVAALGASLLLPMASVRTAAVDGSSLRLAVPPAEQAVANTSGSAVPAPAVAKPVRTPGGRTISYAPSVGAILLGAYLLFLLVRFGVLLWRWIQTEDLREGSSLRSMPPLVEKVWQRCLEAFGLYDVELLSSSSVPSPAAAGAWRKTIILPESLLAGTSEDMLATAIGHEMAHLARRDFAWKMVYEFVFLPISFHPAAFLIRRGIEETREMACDELVTRRLLEPGVYARSIVSIASAMAALPRPGYTLGVFDGDILERRIRRLVERPAASLKRARLLLATGLGALALCVNLASSLAISARAQGGAAQDEINQASAASERGDFRSAAEHLRNAVKMEPENVNAKLSLARAVSSQHMDEPANTGLLDEARQQYLAVLALDPRNPRALDGMASVAIYTRQFSEAHDWVMKLIAADPKIASAYYTAGFLDWSMIYPPYMQARAAAGMKPETQGIIPDAAARKSLRDQYGPQLEEGFRMLQVALSLNPGDSDSMAYINLLYRIQAAIVDSDAESRDAIAKADGWVGKALAARRQRAQDTQQKSAASDANRLGLNVPPPPPPPGMAAALANSPASAEPLVNHNTREVPGTYWQVVAASAMTASALSQSLKSRGFENRLIYAADKLARVMVGPYNDPQSLEQAKAALAAAGVRVVRQW
ncbi:MAG TPA: M56 family metallopeptidase [Candidatus Sulfopaludibacter sp.]|nr:M56 family metallopeptidase [Candidatus Sulfopaludibacter sp.]